MTWTAWTPERDAELARLYPHDYTDKVAEQLGRSLGAVRNLLAMEVGMTTVYAVHVRNGRHFDTYFFRDRACIDFVAKWPWFVSNRPVRRRRAVLNCIGYAIEYVTVAQP